MTTKTKESADGPTKSLTYYSVALVIGVLTALVGTAFHQIVDYMQHNVPLLPSKLGLEGWEAYVFLALLVISMLCGAVALVRQIAPEASGSGIQEVEGAMLGLRQVRWQRVLPVKFIGGLLALGAGLVGGREGPTIHMGASIAQGVAERFKVALQDARSLLGAGAAAGLTTAFNAPIASALFIIEEARDTFPYSRRAYYGVILACGASAVITIALMGNKPFMPINAQATSLSFYPVFIVLGMLLGVLGVGFNKIILLCLDWSRQVNIRYSPYVWPVILGAMIGPLLLLLPQATDGGETLVEQIVNSPLSLGVLFLLVVIRLVMTATSYAAGTPAGIFAPILALATVFSVCFGKILAVFIYLPPDVLATLAVAGMAGLFASTISAPMVGVVLIMELTGNYTLAIPCFLCAISAGVVASALKGRPIYELLLERTLHLADQDSKALAKN